MRSLSVSLATRTALYAALLGVLLPLPSAQAALLSAPGLHEEEGAPIAARVAAAARDLGTAPGAAWSLGVAVATTLTEDQQLRALDGASDDQFGSAVAVDGSRALIGAPDESSITPDGGAVYAFEFDGVAWRQTQKLTPSQSALAGRFGRSIALDGDRALIGRGSNIDAGIGQGAAYVFEHDGTQWRETQRLTSPDVDDLDLFGFDVALDGDQALVSAYLDDAAGTSTGSVFVFGYDGTVWTQQQRLTASDAAAGDQFGFAVALDGNRALIGANAANVGATDTGAAYVFEFDGLTWTEQQKLTASDAGMRDFLGQSVALDGDRVLAGAYFANTAAGNEAGAAYVFEFDGATWNETQKLTASDARAGDRLGISVALDGDRLVAGAYFSDPGGVPNAGAAYVFEFDGAVWSEAQTLTASDGSPGDLLGIGVALEGSRVLAGAFTDDTPAGDDAGSVYAYTLAPAGPDTAPPTLSGTASETAFSGTASDAGVGDTGIASVSLDAGSSNVALDVDPFTVGAASVGFTLTLIDPAQSGSGTVRAADVAGNESTRVVTLSGQAPLEDTAAPRLSGAIVGRQYEGTAEDDRAGDTGIASVTLRDATNLTLQVDAFTPGAASVGFTITRPDNRQQGKGFVVATDAAGNTADLWVCSNGCPPPADPPPPPAEDLTDPEVTGSIRGGRFEGTATDPGADASGIASVGLGDDAVNLVLSVDAFAPGASSVGFTVRLQDPRQPGSGTIVATDVAGNEGTLFVDSSDRLLGELAASTTAPETGLVSVFPNPFNPVAQVRFDLSRDATVDVVVYDVLGREVRRLADGPYLGGAHTVALEGDDLPTGSYFVRLVVDGQPAGVRKISLVR